MASVCIKAIGLYSIFIYRGVVFSCWKKNYNQLLKIITCQLPHFIDYLRQAKIYQVLADAWYFVG